MTSDTRCADGVEEKRENDGPTAGTKGSLVVSSNGREGRKFIEEGRYKSGNGAEMKRARHGWGECQDWVLR